MKISVIIPVYNSSAYIEQCLQSVAAQTLRDIEVLLIDNCGTDGSMAIAEAFVGKSERKDISYRIAATPTNNGPAAARNLGLQLAQGEYVAFLDDDDWVEPEMYETLYNNAQGADMSCCAIQQDFADGRAPRVLENPVFPKSELTISARKRLLTRFAAHFTAYIYRREMIASHGIVFPDSRSAEDSSFLTCCLLSATRVAQTNKAMYHYVIHQGSLTGRKVWKGGDKRRSLRAMLDYARRQGLMQTYRLQLYYIYVKKAWIVPILEML